MSVAALPMYDWPEVAEATDALWRALRNGLRGAGFDAPEALTRGGDPWKIWRARDLLLAQTCGLPYAARLCGDVSLLGAPSYDLPGVPPGRYRSVVVARVGEGADFAGRRFAFNARESQSGWAAFAASFGDPARVFGALVETGAHRASIRSVADGRADFAAVDAVSWRLAERHEPAAEALAVVAETPPTPGLPLITRRRDERALAHMRLVIETEVEMLDPAVRAALFLKGFVKMRPEDYAPLAAGWPRREGET
ncbi:MAG: PhnD/SsuA/transferrin family substrate-binding protein [Pseudomonadota bacterium]